MVFELSIARKNSLSFLTVEENKITLTDESENGKRVT